MKHIFPQALRLIPAIVLSLSPLCAAEGWETSFEKAKATAASGKKDILMDFTGSDWCGWCIKLTEEVFSKDAFKAEAPKHFILMELDFPQEKKLPEELTKQNKELQEKFGIEGFPSIVLTDATGRPYAVAGYEEGGPENYLKSLETLRKIRETRDAAFEKAAKAEGMDKAKALAEGLKEISPELVQKFYAPEVATIVSLDKDDTMGMKAAQAKHERAEKDTAVINELGEKLQALQPDLEALMEAKDSKGFEKKMDDFITENKLTGVGKQFITLQKLAMYGPDRIDDAAKLVDEVIAIDPESEIGQQAAEMKENIKEMKKSVEKSQKEPGDAEELPEAAEEKEAAEKPTEEKKDAQ